MKRGQRTRGGLVIGFTALAAVHASGAVLASNIANLSGGAEAATASRWLAASFATDASAHSLTSVTLMLANPVSGAAELRLYSGGGLEPGTQLGVLTSPAVFSSAAAATVFHGNVALSANRTYWLVLAPTSGQFDWSWTADNSGNGAGFQHVWGFSEDGGAFWWTLDNYPTQFAVSVDEFLHGDMNCDGIVNNFDIDPFVLAITNASGYATQYPNCNILNGDIDNSGTLTNFDIDPFVALIIGG